MKVNSIQLTAHKIASRRSHRAFTLTELMVAVAVLIVVIIATSKIFGTASQITGLGQASASVMTEAATIERQMREDFERLTTEGFFAIRCVAVRNDVNGAAAPLLNPNLPPDAIMRADQLVFFANGAQPMQSFRPSADATVRAQGLVTRVYYGHGFQLRNGSPAAVPLTNTIRAHDPQPTIYNPATNPFPNPTPWYRGNTLMGTNKFGTFNGWGTTGAGTDMYGPITPAAGPTTINGDQPLSRQWLLTRQAIVLLDDDDNARNTNSKTVVFTDHTTARSIFILNAATAPWGFSREIRNGRLDAAASQLDAIRCWVLFNNTSLVPAPADRRPWSGGSGSPPNDQRTVIQSAVYYPRAERRAPSANRVDQALTNHVIGSACSSFAIDWTYDDGVGRVFADDGSVAVTPSGVTLWGMQVSSAQQPWFGLPFPDVNGDNLSDDRGVMRFANWGGIAAPLFANNIESVTAAPPAGVTDCWAVFGYNQTSPLDPSTGEPWSTTPPVQVGYTPFPSAIRVTMTLHDPEGRLEGGREVQFVIRLPKRSN